MQAKKAARRLLSTVEIMEARQMLTTVVPATGDLWLAGMPSGSALMGDVAPANSPKQVTELTVTPGQTLTFSATGTVGYAGAGTDGPEGETGYILVPVSGAQNGIASMPVPVDALIGVFLGTAQPSTTAAPAPLDFTSDAQRNFTTLSPLLKQSFFIGDGKTTGNVVQKFVVPTGATRLFLGTVDGSGWYDNGGAFTVTIGGATTAKPALKLTGNSVVIASGDLAPSTTDFTSMGSAAVGKSITKSFTITNTGTANLTLGATPITITGANPKDFRVVLSPKTPLIPGASTNFIVEFAPTLDGSRTATLTIASNDPTHASYTFGVQGTATGYGTGLGIGGTGADLVFDHVVDASGNVYVAGEFTQTVNFNPNGTAANLTAASTTASDAFVAKYSPTGALLWAVRAGSTKVDRARAIALNPAGGIYVAVAFSGTVDFDPSATTHNLVAKDMDAALWKLDANGKYLAAVSLAGTSVSSFSNPTQVAVDSSGNIFLAGLFSGTVDFNPGSTTQTLTTTTGAAETYVVKLTSALALSWASRLRLADTSHGAPAIAVDNKAMILDASGNPIIAGNYYGNIDLDPGTTNVLKATADAFTPNGFIVKLNASNGLLGFADTFATEVTGVALDKSGGLVATGKVKGTVDFDPSAATNNVTVTHAAAFLLRLDSAGKFAWVKTFGTGTVLNDSVLPDEVAVGPDGALYVVGIYSGSNDFDPGSGTFTLPVPSGSVNGFLFLEKFDSSGNFFSARALVGTNVLFVEESLSVNKDNSVTLAGAFFGPSNTASSSIDLDPGTGVKTLTSKGSDDGFWVTLTGQAAPKLQVEGTGNAIIPNGSAVSLVTGQDFGTVTKNTSKTVHFSLHNTGTATLTLSKFTLAGTNPGDFSLANLPLTIAPGANVQFDFVFKPTVTGARSATLTILSNDPLVASYVFSVKGTGA